MTKVIDMIATSFNSLLISLNGVRLKNSNGNLLVRNPGDTADAEITASKVSVSGNDIVINSDAAGASADWTVTLRRPSTGMTASYVLTMPIDDGSPNQVLATDGNGNTSWVSLAGTSEKISTDTTALAFGSSATVNMFTLPANAEVQEVRVIVDTPFNGTPSMSVGIAGTTSKYLAATQVDLKDVLGAKIYEVYPSYAPSGSTEALQISYSAGGATAGAARVEVEYVIAA